MPNDNDAGERISRLEERVKNLSDSIARCVTIDRYKTVELICYGAAALLLSSVVAAVVALVIRH